MENHNALARYGAQSGVHTTSDRRPRTPNQRVKAALDLHAGYLTKKAAPARVPRFFLGADVETLPRSEGQIYPHLDQMNVLIDREGPRTRNTVKRTDCAGERHIAPPKIKVV